MKALYLEKKITLKDDYPQPKSGEALVRVRLAGICGTDLEMIRGYMDYTGVLGHEFVGVVEKSSNYDLVGKRVVGEINAGCGRCTYCSSGLERHCPQRTVLGIYKRDGAFAQYLSLPEKNLHTIPDSISDEEAVFIEPLAAAFEIEEQIRIQENQKIAIVGDGRLAQLIVRVLKIKNKNITCFGRHQNKLHMLQKMQIAAKMGISKDDEHTFDVVVEATGSESGFSEAIKLAKPRGTIILKSTLASKGNLDFAPAIINEITMVGSRCGPFRPAIEALASGVVKVNDMVSAVYPIEEFEKAFEEAKKPTNIKILLRP